MHRVLLLGAGKIGRMIAKLLSQTGDYDVLVGDTDAGVLGRLHAQSGVATRVLDAQNAAEINDALQGRETLISALSFRSNPLAARLAVAAGANTTST